MKIKGWMSDLQLSSPPPHPVSITRQSSPHTHTLSASPINHPHTHCQHHPSIILPAHHTHTVSTTRALVIFSSLSTGLADLSVIPTHPIVGKLWLHLYTLEVALQLLYSIHKFKSVSLPIKTHLILTQWSITTTQSIDVLVDNHTRCMETTT